MNSTRPPQRPPSRFLLTSAQHRASAEQQRQSGDDELAQQHDNLARAIERRGGCGPTVDPPPPA